MTLLLCDIDWCWTRGFSATNTYSSSYCMLLCSSSMSSVPRSQSVSIQNVESDRASQHSRETLQRKSRTNIVPKFMLTCSSCKREKIDMFNTLACVISKSKLLQLPIILKSTAAYLKQKWNLSNRNVYMLWLGGTTLHASYANSPPPPL